jgi:glycosyltransferase involved in cell wall biosynthesis
MRILHVTHRFLPRYLAGTEVYAGTVAERLAQRGHAVRIFTGDPAATAANQSTWNGMPVISVPWGLGRWQGPVPTFLAGFLNPAVERIFDRVCADFQPDVVHIHHLLGLSPRLPSLARGHGARVVVTLHDYWFVCSNTWLFRWTRQRCSGPGWGYHCVGCALQRLHRAPQPLLMTLLAPVFAARTAILRRSLLRADCLICPSQAVADRYAEQGVPRRLMRVVPHGVHSGMAAAPRPISAISRPLRFTYVGSLTPPKGVHIAVQAFNRLGTADARLDIYGDMTADPTYSAELRAEAVHPGIAFHGPAPRDQIDRLLHATDVLLLPFLWDEPFSLTIDEALRAGRPVMASDLGAPKERVVPGVSGWLVPAGDVAAWHKQIQQLVDRPGLLSGLPRGSAAVKTLDEHIGELEAVYRIPLAAREN